jgi:subtilisin family serine protease
MADPVHRTIIRSSDNVLVRCGDDVIQPIAGFGRQIAKSTFLLSKTHPAAERPPGEEFDNITIEFPIDPIGGATAVPNDDNWGIGPTGFDAQRFWSHGARGQGVRIGIADSGLDLSHPCFANRVASGRPVEFAHFDSDGSAVSQGGASGPTFSHWHGTHCAAILVGEATNGKARGMAPGADLTVTRVLGAGNSGTVASVLSGLWWLVDRHCDVISLSLGWPGLHEEWAPPVEAMLAAGAVVVAAVGNEFSIPGERPSRSPANYPISPSDGSQGLLIAVGACDTATVVWDRSGGEDVEWSGVQVRGTDGVLKPSRYASAPKRVIPAMVGPGVDIISAIPNGEYMSSTGSSMATPHVAGLIALVVSFLRISDPAARPRTAATRVLQSLADIPPAGQDIRSGGGKVDLNALITSIGG